MCSTAELCIYLNSSAGKLCNCVYIFLLLLLNTINNSRSYCPELSMCAHFSVDDWIQEHYEIRVILLIQFIIVSCKKSVKVSAG